MTQKEIEDRVLRGVDYKTPLPARLSQKNMIINVEQKYLKINMVKYNH